MYTVDYTQVIDQSYMYTVGYTKVIDQSAWKKVVQLTNAGLTMQ
jgi:hypothetical protein